QDAGGTLHFSFRQLDPTSGRWSSADPLFHVTTPDRLGAFGEATTSYAYVANNAANVVDPTGLGGDAPQPTGHHGNAPANEHHPNQAANAHHANQANAHHANQANAHHANQANAHHANQQQPAIAQHANNAAHGQPAAPAGHGPLPFDAGVLAMIAQY